jgi:hypothetical protein
VLYLDRGCRCRTGIGKVYGVGGIFGCPLVVELSGDGYVDSVRLKQLWRCGGDESAAAGVTVGVRAGLGLSVPLPDRGTCAAARGMEVGRETAVDRTGGYGLGGRGFGQLTTVGCSGDCCVFAGSGGAVV